MSTVIILCPAAEIRRVTAKGAVGHRGTAPKAVHPTALHIYTYLPFVVFLGGFFGREGGTNPVWSSLGVFGTFGGTNPSFKRFFPFSTILIYLMLYKLTILKPAKQPTPIMKNKIELMFRRIVKPRIQFFGAVLTISDFPSSCSRKYLVSNISLCFEQAN